MLPAPGEESRLTPAVVALNKPIKLSLWKIIIHAMKETATINLSFVPELD